MSCKCQEGYLVITCGLDSLLHLGAALGRDMISIVTPRKPNLENAEKKH